MFEIGFQYTTLSGKEKTIFGKNHVFLHTKRKITICWNFQNFYLFQKYTAFKISNLFCCKTRHKGERMPLKSTAGTPLTAKSTFRGWCILFRQKCLRENSSTELPCLYSNDSAIICNKVLNLKLPGNHSHKFALMLTL